MPRYHLLLIFVFMIMPQNPSFAGFVRAKKSKSSLQKDSGLPKSLSRAKITIHCHQKCKNNHRKARCYRGCLHARNVEQICLRSAERYCASAKWGGCRYPHYKRCMCLIFSKELRVSKRNLFIRKCVARLKLLKKRSHLRYSYRIFTLLKPIIPKRRPTQPRRRVRYLTVYGTLPNDIGIGVAKAERHCKKVRCNPSARRLKTSRKNCMAYCVHSTYREQSCLRTAKLVCKKKGGGHRCLKHYYKICLSRYVCQKKKAKNIRKCVYVMFMVKMKGEMTTHRLTTAYCDARCKTKLRLKKIRCLAKCTGEFL